MVHVPTLGYHILSLNVSAYIKSHVHCRIVCVMLQVASGRAIHDSPGGLLNFTIASRSGPNDAAFTTIIPGPLPDFDPSGGKFDNQRLSQPSRKRVLAQGDRKAARHKFRRKRIGVRKGSARPYSKQPLHDQLQSEAGRSLMHTVQGGQPDLVMYGTCSS